MTEAPSPVFFAQAKPEHITPPKPEQSKTVSGVRKAVDKWLERIGPKSVENHFVKAHENILATLDNDQRKETYKQTAEKWRKTGKIIGFASTIFDFGLAGFGTVLTTNGLRNPHGVEILFSRTIIDRLRNYRLTQPITQVYDSIFTLRPGMQAAIAERDILRDRSRNVGNIVSLLPALGSLGIILGAGPTHGLAHLIASSAESIGKMKARTNNYVDSGKAAEHANKVSNALGKAATETVKWVAEHPEEIRKTVETVNRVKQENAQTAQKIKEAQQKTVEAKLEADYQDWIAHHPDKVYYEQSGQPMPSKADYVEIKRREEAAKQAAREEEKRGEAK